jgi:hypothetical protein
MSKKRMTPNDAQMDVLLRRHAKHAKSDTATGHLDADELNAFAEGSLPTAARSRYVSHLSHCDDCRQIVTQLSISAGALANAEVEQSSPAITEGLSFWQKLGALFAVPTLRYAAFAAVLLMVAGVAFLALRRPSQSSMVAQNEPASQAPVSVVKPGGEATPATSTVENKQGKAGPSVAPSQPSQESSLEAGRDESKGAKPAQPPKPETGTSADSPVLAAKKAAELPATNPSSPTYAPPPPGEVASAEKSREQQTVGGIASVSGPRKSEPLIDKSKTTDRARTGETTKDDRAEDNSRRAALNQQSSNSSNSGRADEKSGGPKRNQDTQRNQDNIARNRNENEARVETAKTPGTGTASRAPSEEAQTRSAGGRKFRRQGNAWIDQKFKSSMTLKNVSRGSDEFAAFDSGLRSIAQQLGGEIIVVWKNKAYLIR